MLEDTENCVIWTSYKGKSDKNSKKNKSIMCVLWLVTESKQQVTV